MKATLNIIELEKELAGLYEAIMQDMPGAEGSGDPEVATNLAMLALRMDAMGSILRAVGHSIEGDEARARFLTLQRRFQGFKGAALGAAKVTMERIQKEQSKN